MNTDTKRLVNFIENNMHKEHAVHIQHETKMEKTTIGYGSSEHDTEVETIHGRVTFNMNRNNHTLIVVIDYRVGFDRDTDYALPTSFRVSVDNHNLVIDVKEFSADYRYKLYKLIEKSRVRDKATAIVDMLKL